MKKKLLCACLVLACCLTACGGENTEAGTASDSSQGAFGDASMEDLKAAVVETLGEDYWPNMTADEQILFDLYGIPEDLYDDFLAELPMISTNVDTLIIIKAKEGQEDAVEKILNDYRDRLVNDSFQYPMNLGKIQASRIEAFDNYICFVQLGGDVSDLLDQGEDVVIAHCQEHNEKALDVIRTALAE